MAESQFAKPIIVVSQCLEFAACRWNGLMIKDEFVRQLMPLVDFVPICPEFEIGLGIPREPIRVVESKGQALLYQPASGKDFSAKMSKFSKGFLDSLGDVDGFLLKSRSPSCGIKDVKIYGGIDKAPVTGKGAGFFGRMVVEKFGDLAVEDEGRLTNLRIRDHFLTRIFALAAWRNLPLSMAALVEFQASNKLLLMAYSQKRLRILGKIAANHEKNNIKQVFTEYDVHFKQALANLSKTSSNINVLMHALGYFKNELKAAEKLYFLKTLDSYSRGKIPLSVPIGIIRGWVARYDQAYLRSQTYFEPYPEDLVQPGDSGKGRES